MNTTLFEPITESLTEQKVFDLRSLTAFELEKIFATFSRIGCVLIENNNMAPAIVSDALAALNRHFGAAIFHKLSDANGIHPIETIAGYSEYANTTNADLQLHTDGSFEPNTPKTLILHCETPSEQGGLSRVCFAEPIYQHLAQNHPAALPGLFRADAVTIRRDDRQATRAIFTKLAGRIQMIYRIGSDISIDVHPDARAGFAEIEKFISDPQNFIEFQLEPNQTLIMDNTRILHGRTGFPMTSARKLYGLWGDGSAVVKHQFSLGFPEIKPSDD